MLTMPVAEGILNIECLIVGFIDLISHDSEPSPRQLLKHVVGQHHGILIAIQFFFASNGYRNPNTKL